MLMTNVQTNQNKNTTIKQKTKLSGVVILSEVCNIAIIIFLDQDF